jgi:hypothetical protein
MNPAVLALGVERDFSPLDFQGRKFAGLSQLSKSPSTIPKRACRIRSARKLDNPPRVAVEGQRCLPEKDTAALNEIRQLQADDAPAVSKRVRKAAAISVAAGISLSSFVIHDSLTNTNNNAASQGPKTELERSHSDEIVGHRRDRSSVLSSRTWIRTDIHEFEIRDEYLGTN